MLTTGENDHSDNKFQLKSDITDKVVAGKSLRSDKLYRQCRVNEGINKPVVVLVDTKPPTVKTEPSASSNKLSNKEEIKYDSEYKTTQTGSFLKTDSIDIKPLAIVLTDCKQTVFKEEEAGENKNMWTSQNKMKIEKVEELKFNGNTKSDRNRQMASDAFVKLERLEGYCDAKGWQSFQLASLNKTQKGIDKKLWNLQNVTQVEEYDRKHTTTKTKVLSSFVEKSVVRQEMDSFIDNTAIDSKIVDTLNTQRSTEKFAGDYKINMIRNHNDKLPGEEKDDQRHSFKRENTFTSELLMDQDKEKAGFKQERSVDYNNNIAGYCDPLDNKPMSIESIKSEEVVTDKELGYKKNGKCPDANARLLNEVDVNLLTKFNIFECSIKLTDLVYSKKHPFSGNTERIQNMRNSNIVCSKPSSKKKRNTSLSDRCRVCKIRFSNRRSLANHERSHQLFKYKCDICRKLYRAEDGLLRHKALHSVSKYECNKCRRIFTTHRKLYVHELKHSGKRPYKCDECNRWYNAPKELDEHKNIHRNVYPYKCEQCDREFTAKTYLHLHQYVHTKERKFSCEKCGKAFKRKRDLQRHLPVHTNARPVKCPECDKTYKFKASLCLHKRSHTGEYVRCNICQRKFRDAGDLKKHYGIHSGIKPYQCDTCRKFFRTKSGLISHLSIHMDPEKFEKRHLCNFCGKRYMYLSALREHENIHKTEKLKVCEKCGQAFSLKNGLINHLKHVHGKMNRTFVCGICNKVFHNRGTFSKHKKFHTDGAKYPCKFCFKSYALSYHLKRHIQNAHLKVEKKTKLCRICNLRVRVVYFNRHMRVHNDLKPFVCKLCGKCFKHQSNLNVHASVHLEKKPWKCDTCGLCCSQLGGLKLHIERKH